MNMKTLSEALELEVADIGAGLLSRMGQMMARTFWKSQCPAME
jgi:hypothetical protein